MFRQYSVIWMWATHQCLIAYSLYCGRHKWVQTSVTGNMHSAITGNMQVNTAPVC